MHNTPDPDSLASSLALKFLVQQLWGIRSHIVLSGIVGRAENAAMVRLLKISFLPQHMVSPRRYKFTALVDTQPRFGNNSFPKDLRPTIVIDHHPLKKTTRAAFIDVRPGYGATATILAEYLRAAGLKPTSRLATALCYGISSETQALGREASPQDVAAYLELFPLISVKTMAKILYPPLSDQYFKALERALHNAFVYRQVVGTRVGEVDSPDVVAQIADMLLRRERTSWAICIGRYQGQLIISLRTSNRKAKAGRLLQRVLAGYGSAGGHDVIAGGQVELTDISPEKIERLEEMIFGRFFSRLGLGQAVQPRSLLGDD